MKLLRKNIEKLNLFLENYPKVVIYFPQFLIILLLGIVISYFSMNASTNMAARGIETGFGFLANNVRGKLLPKIYKIFKQIPKAISKTKWADLYKESWMVDPLRCILCGGKMLLTATVIGLSSKELMEYHENLAKRKRII